MVKLYSMCAHSGALKRFYRTCVKMTISLFHLVVAISTIINLFPFPNYFVALSQYFFFFQLFLHICDGPRCTDHVPRVGPCCAYTGAHKKNY